MAHEDVAEMSYEQARGQLEAVVTRLEAGDLPLEELMTLWERGEVLARACEDRLAAPPPGSRPCVASAALPTLADAEHAGPADAG